MKVFQSERLSCVDLSSAFPEETKPDIPSIHSETTGVRFFYLTSATWLTQGLTPVNPPIALSLQLIAKR
jgi:hypothetical protein